MRRCSGVDGDPPFREAACFAHWRRGFHEIWTSQKSEIAQYRLKRIGHLYDIEREIARDPAHLIAPCEKREQSGVRALACLG